MIRGLPGVLARIEELRTLMETPAGTQSEPAAKPVTTAARPSTPPLAPTTIGKPEAGGFGAMLTRAMRTQSAGETAKVGWDTKYDDLVQKACARYGVDQRLVHAVIRAESDYNPRCVSHAGAMGLMQLMPENCKDYGVSDPFDPAQNIDGGVRHLKDMLDGQKSLALGLAAYNAGPGAVKRYGGIPPYRETQNYVNKILGWLAEG